MRCEIDRSVFAEMLAAVVNMLPSRTTYPVLQNILMVVKDGRLSLAGTDLDTYIKKEFTLSGAADDGRAILPGRKLAEITREIGDSSIRITGKDSSIQLDAGGVRASFVSLDPAEFPEMPKPPEGLTMEFPLATLMELLDTASFAVSKDESRPAMTGVNWEVSKTETRLVATDGHRLAYVCRRGKFANKLKAIVTPKVFGVFPRGEESVKVYSDPSRIAFLFQNTTVIGRLIEGPYPDYERVIPRGSQYKAVVEKDAFSAALRRAAVFAHPVGRLVALTFKKNKVQLHAEAPDLGKSDEETDCVYEGEEIRIGFNAGYLLEALRHIEADKVDIELSGPLSAGLFRPTTQKPDTEETFLLMPIRLD